MEEKAGMEERAIKEKLAEILSGWEKDRRRLIPLLQSVQEEFGYLPKAAIGEIGAHLGLNDVQIRGVASFYNHFRFIPLGKHPVQMCLGTACHMVGGSLVLEALERALELKVGSVSEDGEFSLDRVACIGCCGLAPVMVFDKKIHARVTPTKVDEVLVNLRTKAAEAEKAEREGTDGNSAAE
jgi:NADH-quinone oxidoreductase subunit E